MIDDLVRAAAREDWETVSQLLDASFYRYLFEDAAAVQSVLDRAPHQWFEEYPRLLLSRAIVDAVCKSRRVVNGEAAAPYQAWVAAQDAHAPRDVLACRLERLRVLIAHAWYRDASNEVDATLQYLQSAPFDAAGLPDIMPAVLLGCGIGKLLAGELDAAASCFIEVTRRSSSEPEHPYATFGREHLALAHALNERYSQAAELLPEDFIRSEPGTLKYLREPAGVVARLLVAVGTLDLQTADAILQQIDGTIRDAEFGWMVIHAEAMLALAHEAPWDAAHRVTMHLEVDSLRTAPASFGGAVLRADLVGLFQAAGDLRAADRVLGTKGLLIPQSHVVVAQARQSMLQGRPESVLQLLQQEESRHGSTAAVRFRPSGAVIYGAAELAMGERGSRCAIHLAASAVTHDGARWALMAAPTELRQRLLPLVGTWVGTVPQPWVHSDRVKLTPRELEILGALRVHRTIKEVATDLHVSPNTAKTHVRTLYRKLGVHSREDALRSGRDLEM
ncbi:hypothetical protein ITJ66_16675 [Plantibacter sp. VKM Ac-2885]|nr:hypothetical protein [Plantibacter sp. VKM Ac-2885]